MNVAARRWKVRAELEKSVADAACRRALQLEEEVDRLQAQNARLDAEVRTLRDALGKRGPT